MAAQPSTEKKRAPKINASKLNWILDLALALVFAVEMEEHFTGLRIHELLGLFFGIALVLHIVLHWNWVVTITKQFFNHLFHESRLNYALNLGLFISMGMAVVSGILISRTLGLQTPLRFDFQFPMQMLHLLTSSLSLILVALHVALHWKWILTHTQKYIRLPFSRPVLETVKEPVRITQDAPNS